MTWYAIYNSDTGELYSTGTVVADTLPQGLVSKPISGEPQSGFRWNPATLDFEAFTSLPETWTVYQFLMRMTATERVAIRERAKTNPYVYDFMDLLSHSGEVVRSNPVVLQGLNYIESLGDIGPGRAQVILNG
jgi:hypothetical protein